MIVVKVEMWPNGDESRAVEFGRMVIINQEQTTIKSQGHYGDYKVELRGGVYGRTDLYQKLWKRGKVEGFPRKTRGLWDLMFVALRGLVGRRN